MKKYDVIATSQDGDEYSYPVILDIGNLEEAKRYADQNRALPGVRVVLAEDYGIVLYEPVPLHETTRNGGVPEMLYRSMLDDLGYYSHQCNVVGLYERRNGVQPFDYLMSHFPNSPHHPYVPRENIIPEQVSARYNEILTETYSRYQEACSAANYIATWENQKALQGESRLTEWSPVAQSYVARPGTTCEQFDERMGTITQEERENETEQEDLEM